MKTIMKITALSAFLLILAGGFSSCGNENLYFIPFEGSWRLAGIMYHEQQSFVELEPKDCDMCFTLTFVEVGEERSVVKGLSILNTVSITIAGTMGNVTYDIQITNKDEPYEGNRYTDYLRRMSALYIGPSPTLLIDNPEQHSQRRLKIHIVENNIITKTLYFDRIEKIKNPHQL